MFLHVRLPLQKSRLPLLSPQREYRLTMPIHALLGFFEPVRIEKDMVHSETKTMFLGYLLTDTSTKQELRAFAFNDRTSLHEKRDALHIIQNSRKDKLGLI